MEDSQPSTPSTFPSSDQLTEMLLSAEPGLFCLYKEDTKQILTTNQGHEVIVTTTPDRDFVGFKAIPLKLVSWDEFYGKWTGAIPT